MNVLRPLAVLVITLLTTSLAAQTTVDLAGLWEAKLRFGPDVRGPLTIARDADGWRGEIAGFSVPARVVNDEITLQLPNETGELRAHIDKAKTNIRGHWIQPPTVTFGARFASPVTLTKVSENLWRGEVVPLDDEHRFYLRVSVRPDGTLAAFFRNPERNLGRRVRVDSIEREGETVRLLDAKRAVLAQGTFRDGMLSVAFPNYGGTFDFHRVEEGQRSDFYPRGLPSVPYVYRPPRPRDDGWPVGTVEEAGISREAITKFIQMVIDTPIDKANAMELHGLLIARHGKLVVEEYFHGEHADKPHDTRSAAKTVASTMIGAAIQKGAALSVNASVYSIMNDGKMPEGLEARKRALQLEHLLTMTPGLHCEDSDPKAPGAEDAVLDGDHPDYYRYVLDLPAESDPGTHAVYCSMAPHLAGGVLSRATGKSLPRLFDELIAAPMGMKRYHMNLTPTGDAYMGGGMRFLPRDFLKLAQMHMDGGRWKGRQIVSAEWARRATSPLQTISKRGYGYFWWVDDRPYKGRTVRTWMAGGNGSQVAMAVPELDLVIGFWGGNYSDPVLFVPQNEYVADWILPAVDEGK